MDDHFANPSEGSTEKVAKQQNSKTLFLMHAKQEKNALLKYRNNKQMQHQIIYRSEQNGQPQLHGVRN